MTMLVDMLKSKIHRATVTQAEVDYVGSITIDANLMEAAEIHEYEKVLVADVNNGSRLETYAIAGDAGSGVICLNGAAARLADVGDTVIIMSFCRVDAEKLDGFAPRVVFVDKGNAIMRVARYEKHGQLSE